MHRIHKLLLSQLFIVREVVVWWNTKRQQPGQRQKQSDGIIETITDKCNRVKPHKWLGKSGQ